ncbi:hypothetical protein [Aliihoeflea sp. PC F10.4]
MLVTLLSSLVAGETSNIIGRMKRAAVAYSAAAFFILLGVLFALIAAYIWAATRWSPITAALIFAGTFVALAIVTVVFQSVTAKTQARRAARKRAVDTKALATTAAVAALPALLANPRSAAALTVPVLGVIGYLIYKENAGPRAPRRRGRAPLDDL